ncbi:hypothetical protein N9Z25_06705 [Luminiphilus sp.]|nr:hypothetical protein [Luminiphilus sp.]
MKLRYVVINCRTSQTQRDLAVRLARDKNFRLVDISPIFIHADKSNLGILNIFRSFTGLITFVRFLPHIIAAACFVGRHFSILAQTFHEAAHQRKDINGRIFYFDGMRSTLAKRMKQTTWQGTRVERKYLWIMCFDTVMAQLAVQKLGLINCEEVCIFNGRMVPEFVIRQALNNVKFFELGGADKIYFGEAPPLSVSRFTEEFPELTPGELENCDINIRLATIFLTSDYEYAFAGDGFEPASGCFQTQYESVETAVKCLDERGVKVRIKAHPGSGKEQHDFVEDLASRFPMLEIVSAPADELIASSCLVLVSSSSAAVEAALAGKVVAHLMPSFYQNLGVSVYVGSKNQLERFLGSPCQYSSQKHNAKVILESEVFQTPLSPTLTEFERLLLRLKYTIWGLR